MRKLSRFAFTRHRAAILFVCAMIYGLTSCSEADSTAPVVRGRHIVPEAGNGIVVARHGTTDLSIQDQDESVVPRVRLDDDLLFISALDVNLDIDEPEEQIVVVKRRDDAEDRVSLLITDFDTLRSTYRVTWEGTTRATNVRTFAVYTMDLIGDHLDEIVTVGTDADGNQTMNVFRRRQAGTLDPGLAYREIFTASSDGSIEIDDLPRSGAYRTLQSDGVSFPIQVFERNETTETPLDLIQTIWVWRVPENRYVRSEVVPIPAMQIEETQLRELYNAEADEMERFLEGPWFRTTGEDLTERAELAYFDPQTREVVLSRGDTQERFEWLNSYKTLYAGGPGLWINLRNEVLSTVRRQLSITVHGLETISLSDDGAEYWTGRYQRMTPGIQSSVVRDHTLGTPSFELSGVFRNENDAELLLNRPHFRLRTPDFDWSGGFNIIQLTEPVLELKVTDADSTPAAARMRNDGTFSVRYAMGYTEQRSEERLVRRLALEPVELTADGLEHTGGVSFVLEQVEELDVQS